VTRSIRLDRFNRRDDFFRGMVKATANCVPVALALQFSSGNGSPRARPARSDREEATMLNNATYNLMETASIISKGLHRYDTFRKDAEGCQQCQQIWNHLKQADEEQLKRLTTHMKDHLDKEPEFAAQKSRAAA
jgi:hypothetical protein